MAQFRSYTILLFCQCVTPTLLGEKFSGILNSDRYNAYNWLNISQRQLCWAHLKREFTKISERKGVSRQLGRDLLAQ